MGCDVLRCKSACCYNIPFANGELELFSKFIVNKVIDRQVMANGGVLAFTDTDPFKNKCPFLRKDYKCNIYHNRPEVCRLMAETPQLTCEYYK